MREYTYEPKNIYYRTNEFRDGRATFVFIHGLSGSSSAWAKYEENLQDKYNILTYDIRGHGKSQKYDHLSDYGIGKFSRDLSELLDFLEINLIILIGHSYATLICFEFLKEHGNRVKKLVLLSPNAAPKDIPAGKIIKPLLRTAKILEYLPCKNRSKGHIDYARFKNTGDWNIRRMYADIKNTGIRTYLLCSLKSYDADYRDSLRLIDIPTLIMHGKEDSIFPYKNSVLISKEIKKSELVLIDNADHILVLNHFDIVSAEIERFSIQ